MLLPVVVLPPPLQSLKLLLGVEAVVFRRESELSIDHMLPVNTMKINQYNIRRNVGRSLNIHCVFLTIKRFQIAYYIT